MPSHFTLSHSRFSFVKVVDVSNLSFMNACVVPILANGDGDEMIDLDGLRFDERGWNDDYG